MIDRLLSNPIATLAAVCLLAVFFMSLVRDIRLALPRWFLSLLILSVALYAASAALGSPSLDEIIGWVKP